MIKKQTVGQAIDLMVYASEWIYNDTGIYRYCHDRDRFERTYEDDWYWFEIKARDVIIGVGENWNTYTKTKPRRVFNIEALKILFSDCPLINEESKQVKYEDISNMTVKEFMEDPDRKYFIKEEHDD